MRIAHICATFPPYMGGTGNVCFYNAFELTHLGHEVHVFTPGSGRTIPEDTVDGIHVHRMNPLFHFGNASVLPGLRTLHSFDVIHLHFPFFGGEFAALAASRQHIPLVVTYHQDVHLQGFLQVVEKVLRITVSRWLLTHAACVLFTSLDYSHASYARNLLRGRENRIGELPNGVDPNHFCPGLVDPLLIGRYKFSDEDYLALLVARLDRAHFFKGVPILLQAIAQLSESVKLIIVGEGDLKDYYINLARSMNLQNRVFFSDRVSSEELPQYYRMANVTILPSTTMGEAFGLVLLESLACGTPVIASNLPGVRTVVSDSVDGYLVQPGDVDDLRMKLQQIISMPEHQRIAMGVAGRRKVEQKYTWELSGQRLEQIYQDVIDHHVG